MTITKLCRWLAGGALLAATTAAAESPAEPPAGLPAEFQQIIPRGRIASVDAPEFVAAGKAKIPDDAWVLGVAVGGEARAYSLNLLNEHEIVNDRIGGRPVAAVW